MKTSTKIVKQALEWIGKKESDGTHQEIIDIYNDYKPLPRNYKVKYTDAWCATFISALAIKCGYTDIIPIECSCEHMRLIAKCMGIWVESDDFTPRPGDIILYDWGDSGIGDNTGYPDHVGIVTNVGINTFTVVEGNKNDSVSTRTMKINGKYIRGYICPDYDAQPTFYPATTYRGYSIVDALLSVGEKDVSRYHRGEIATANGILDYKGTSTQNVTMLNLLKAGLLKKPV